MEKCQINTRQGLPCWGILPSRHQRLGILPREPARRSVCVCVCACVMIAEDCLCVELCELVELPCPTYQERLKGRLHFSGQQVFPVGVAEEWMCLWGQSDTESGTQTFSSFCLFGVYIAYGSRLGSAHLDLGGVARRGSQPRRGVPLQQL